MSSLFKFLNSSWNPMWYQLPWITLVVLWGFGLEIFVALAMFAWLEKSLSRKRLIAVFVSANLLSMFLGWGITMLALIYGG